MKSIFAICDGDDQEGVYRVDGTPFRLSVLAGGAFSIHAPNGCRLDLMTTITHRRTSSRLVSRHAAIAVGLAIQDFCR